MRFLSVALLALVLTACGGGDDEPDPTTLSDAERCANDDGDTNKPTLEINDGSLTLTSPTQPDDSLSAELYTLTGVACVVSALDGPEGLAERVGQTNALQGSQETSWDNFEASYSYSPAGGLIFIVTED